MPSATASVHNGRVAGLLSNACAGRARRDRLLVVTHSVCVQAPPDRAFRPIRQIGGDSGWYFGNRLWRLRGIADRLVGGAGFRRGRRDAGDLAPGDALDFWRVEAYERDRLLRLRAEMRMPGRVWLQFDVEGSETVSTIRQTTLFEPKGLAGVVYWYVLHPADKWIYAGMLNAIARRV
jgi:hypothetical protein